MSRSEENEMIIEEITKVADSFPKGTCEEITLFKLDVISTMLADISKSLAVIADKAEKEDKNA